MEHYILELIRDNNRVIVPNFGAFIVAKEKGFTILFNNFLSFNDGLLVDYVMKKEEVDKLEATDRVNKFVELINKTLDTTGTFTLDGLGAFTKDANGILRFVQAEELNQSDLFKGDDDESKNELLDLESTDIVEVPEYNTATETEIPPAPDSVEVDEKEEEEINNEEFEPAPEQPDTIEKEEKKKRSVALFIILFVLIPIVGFGAYYLFFNKSKTEKEKPQIKKEVKTTPPAKPVQKKTPKKVNEVIDAGPENTITKKKPVKAGTPQQTVKPKQVSGISHHLIAGSFTEEKNADNFLRLMRNKGFRDAVKINHKKMYLISIGSFPTLSKTMARQEEILIKLKVESWVLTLQ